MATSTIAQYEATLALDMRDRIGEGPAWDGKNHRLLWADHEKGVIHGAKPDPTGAWQETSRWDLGRPLAAVIPRKRGGLIVAGGLDMFSMDEEGRTEPFVSIEADPRKVRLNDAKCDPRGRLWAGSLTNDFSAGGAALYRIDPDGSVRTMLDRLTLSNGLDWSPTGETFYFIDSVTCGIDAFDYDLERGTLSNRRTFVTLERGCGVPNGMTVDRDGCVWVAATGAGEVQQYSPAGDLLGRVRIATPGATSCAFGGVGGDVLCITALGRRMGEVALKLGVTEDKMENNGPGGGGLFTCRTGARGAPATAFAG